MPSARANSFRRNVWNRLKKKLGPEFSEQQPATSVVIKGYTPDGCNASVDTGQETAEDAACDTVKVSSAVDGQLRANSAGTAAAVSKEMLSLSPEAAHITPSHSHSSQKHLSYTEDFLAPSSQKLELTECSRQRESEGEDVTELSCAICLELPHRPRVLACGHSFCLLCLQNYANCCVKELSCPSCRGTVRLPPEGVVGLPPNRALSERVRKLQKSRGHLKALFCHDCHIAEGWVKCAHCGLGWCRECGSRHAERVKADLLVMQERLGETRESLQCRREEHEAKLSLLEENISAAVDEQMLGIQQKGLRLASQVEQMRQTSLKQTKELSTKIDDALFLLNDRSTGNVQELDSLGRLHSSLSHLLKKATSEMGPRVTLDEENLTLKLSLTCFNEAESDLIRSSEEEGQPQVHDHSLFFRKKSSYARHRWRHRQGGRPAGVAICPWTSNIYVTGSDSCRVSIFDSSGQELSNFGARGHSDGQLLCPFGITFSLVSREIFITDKWKHCIQVFDATGRFLRQLGRKGKGRGQFCSPEGIAMDKYGQIYVADTCNNRVQVLDSDGVFLREVGVVSSETRTNGRLYTKTEFTEPAGVAVNADGSLVYIADAGSHRIRVYNGRTGERVCIFGSHGRNRGQFDSPECIAVDSEGFIIVGDSGNGRIQVFRPSGNFVRYFGVKQNCHGEFGWVSGVALSKSFDIVATDFKHNVIGIF